MKRSTLLTSIGTLLLSQLSYGAAFQFYELGTPVVGTADVGQAALANDASTAYFNPAGMAALPSSEFMLGAQMLLPYIHFSANSSTTMSGNNGGNAGLFTPGIDGYYVYSHSSNLKFGISLTTPYAGVLNYNNHWVGRYNVQQMTMYTLNLNPAMAYQLNDWIALGGGFSVEYANFSQSVAIPISATEDGQATLKLSNVASGFNVGILLTPYRTTKMGIAYRSQIKHDLTGDIDFMNITTAPAANTKMIMPANVIASISQLVTNKLTVLGELGWSNWSSMVDTVVNVLGYTAVTPLNWHDTYRVGLGGQYKALPSLLLQAGISYDSSPTTRSRRLPDLPMDRQIRVGAGLAYEVMHAVTLGASYEYLNFGSAPIQTTSSYGTLAGSYARNFTNVFQLSMNVVC